jgi:hypothetical protein
MDLTTLAKQLQAQAQANGTLVLNASVLSSAELANLSAAFLLTKGQYLTITGIKAADIPDPQANSLTITAGTIDVFAQTQLTLQLVFTLNEAQLNVLIAVRLPAAWMFKDSFPKLDAFPFNRFSLQDCCFIYSSIGQTNYAPWPKSTETIALEAGLNFAGWLKLDRFSSLLALLANIIGAGDTHKFFGAFAPSADAYPVTTLAAVLSDKGFSIGYAPLDLALTAPTLLAQIAPVDGGTQDMGLALQAALQLGLQFTIGISAAGDALSVSATPVQGQPFTANKILQLPGGSDFQSFIPTELSTLFASVGLKYYTMVMLTDSKTIGSMELAIGTVELWKIIPGKVVELDSLVLQLNLIAPSTSSSLTAVTLSATASILPAIFTDDFAFSVDIQKSSSGLWQVGRIQGEYNGIVKLGDLVHGILGNTFTVPKELNEISFYNFGLIVDKTAHSYVCCGGIECNFPLLNTQINSALLITVTYSNNAYEVLLTGVLTIGGQSFDLLLDFSKQSGQKNLLLSASWAENGTDSLQFEDIATAFGWDSMPTIPPELNLTLTGAAFTYNLTTGSLIFGTQSKNYGNAVFVSLPVNGTQEYFFLLGVDETFSLSNLPLIGNELANIENIQVGDFQIIIGSKVADTTAAAAISALIATLPSASSGSSYPKMPDTGTTGDFVLSAQINFGDQQHALPLMLSMGGSGSGTQPSSTVAAASTTALATTATGGTVTPSTSPDGTTWFTVQKSFGAVTIQRIGAMYQPAQQTLWFEIDASLAMGPMSLTMVGLGIGSSIADFVPKFSLQGMGIAYTKPPLAIAGSFVNLNPPQGLEFEGSVMIGAESFELEAFGFYGDQKGSPSMFIFGDLAKSFGGPPAFFVTGAALGFGYNSALRLPSVDQVASFPFIEVLPNSNPPNTLTPPESPQDALNVIMTTSPPWVAEQSGALWFAAGITFTSFEIVNSQALVIVEPGTDLTISLIGTSQAQFPQDTGAGGPVYAYLALDLDVVFKPEEGVFTLQAVLSRASFLLDRSCVLTGGFAFYIWFGDNPHSGDFVLTLGGYNPGFLPPSYYPTVPPLGFHWSVDSSITISGNAYLAFTPSVMMMGGELSAVYQSGDLKAWFDAHADIIVQWKPFWFDADIGITIGASYRVDLLFTSFTVSVELGCDLQLWGPPTGGSVYVDWYIISFTVPFGASKSSEPIALIWADVQAMLPNTGTPEAPNILSLTPTTGFTPSSTKSAGGSPPAAWIVRGSQFGFSTSSPIPATTATVGGTYAFKGSTFNVAPLDWTGVSATHEITITDTSSKPKDWSFAFAAKQIQKSLPSSLWGSPPSTTPRGDSQLVANQIVGVTLQVNLPQIGSSAGAVNVELYLEGAPLDLPGATLPISELATPSGDIPINTQTTISTIANTNSGIASIDTVATRNAIFDVLQTAGYAPISTNDPMTNFAKEIGCALNAEPLLVA